MSNKSGEVQIVADTVIDDTLSPIPYGPSSGCIPFTIGDTIAASYFVQLDSVVSRKDGVEHVQRRTYDNLYRINSIATENNACEHITEYGYESDLDANMRSRHYLSALAYNKEYEVEFATADTILHKFTDYDYASDFPSQSYSGQDKFFYNSESKSWIDLDMDHTIDTSPDDDFIISQVLDVNIYGDPLYIQNPDSFIVGYAHNYRGNQAAIQNIGSHKFIVDDFEQQIIGDLRDGEIDSTVSFTGRSSVRIISSDCCTKYGPEYIFPDLHESEYIVEVWAKCYIPNNLFICAEAYANGSSNSVVKYVTDYENWQRLVCTLSVSDNDTMDVKVYTLLSYVTSIGYVDDIRIYPKDAQVETWTFDGMRRIKSESDYNNIPERTYYNQYNEPNIIADHENNPISGFERFYKTTEASLHMCDGYIQKYHYLLPNAMLNLPRFIGHIEKIELTSIRRCVYVEEASSV